jgi:hypothetical protein
LLGLTGGRAIADSNDIDAIRAQKFAQGLLRLLRL